MNVTPAPIKDLLNEIGGKTLTLIANIDDPNKRRSLCWSWTNMSWELLEGFGYQYRDGEDRNTAIAGHVSQNIAYCERQRANIVTTRRTGEK